MLEEVERWLADRSWSVTDRPVHRLLAAKRATGQTVSVVLPALNEEATVGGIVTAIRHDLMLRVPPRRSTSGTGPRAGSPSSCTSRTTSRAPWPRTGWPTWPWSTPSGTG
ncbi:hypothetical protein SHIRM173S_08641 [Streptomyces hirsutus]